MTASLPYLAVLVAALTLAWGVSLRLRDASIVDICWGPAFVLLAWLYCTHAGTLHPRAILLASLVTIWGARLAAHIYSRHRGEDFRYRAMRERHGHAFWWRSLFTVFWLQAAIAWLVSLPLFAAARVPEPSYVTHADIAGSLIFVTGFLFEAVGDRQLARFRANPSNRGKVLDTGLWRYTRHPNYFGDALLWWGIYVIAASAPGGWLTIFSPVLMTWLLLRVSGVAMLEPALAASKPGYAAYVARTSAFVPWPPRGD